MSAVTVLLTVLYKDSLCVPVAKICGAVLSGGAQGEVLQKSESVRGELSQNAAAETLSGFAGGAAFSQDEQKLTDTPDDIKKLMAQAQSKYASFKKSGDISEKQFGASSLTLQYGRVKLDDKTDSHKPDIKTLLEKRPSLGTVTKDEPYILIYHTHTTEGYELLDKGWYSNDYDSRTEDGSKTVVRVGDAICERLEKAGYNVIHDKTVYDASYNGAYSRSLITVEKTLKKYPSIMITLDVHRDAIHYDSGTKCKPTAVIDGKKAAQVMIISGCEEGDITDFGNWEQNLVFALALQNAAEERFEGLMRPVFFCRRKYNMNVTPCSLLLEFGTDANTLEEAVYSGSMIGEALAGLLDADMKKNAEKG